jgi:cation:H+ antiporter
MLWKAADALVAGAVSLADGLGISPLIIALTIIAMGTSAPEAATSIAAAVRNTGEVAIGNVFGSNVANLLLAAGLAALIRPIGVQLKVLKREMPVMVIVALLLWPVLVNLHLSRMEGLALLALFAVLIGLTIWAAKKEAAEKPHAQEELKEKIKDVKKVKERPVWLSSALIVIGLVGLALGAELSLRGAIYIGEQAGLSKSVIGLTIVAVGTSLPELATCIVAAVKGHDDISIGNLVGSNIFNTLLVTGTAGVVRPFAFPTRLAGADYWIMVGVSIVFMAMAISGRKISRSEGGILTAGYAGYIVYLLVFTRAI